MHLTTPLAFLATSAITTSSAAPSMGFIGCSTAENFAQGYVAVGGSRMWGPYGTNGMVFDQQVTKYGKPSVIWVQICISTQDATYDEVKQLVANARQHAAGNATIYITGRPLYEAGQTCQLAGPKGPESTDAWAKRAEDDKLLSVIYPGSFLLKKEEVQDGCHVNTAGQQSLGKQALSFWG
ncbi:hypothetical protein EK21DRAFT_89321 [Setomelanomma holmii]|uniref:Uncharacterized protein n=1 Tax=Setomelanomma holmii TaxID=210430 RepID=A0A9P4LMP3_9PLEO|nr:hypothetical protein EK21DRAFT_89321 [Setomelanomma holmii]